MFFCFSRTLLDVFYTGTQISDTSGKPFANFPLLWTLLEVQVLCSVMSYRLVCFCPYLEGTVVLPKVGDYTIYHPVQRNMAENFNLQRQLCESHNAKSLHGFECFLSESCASACKTSTTQTQPHQISNTQRTENKTTDVVIQQHSRKLLKMDILMSETCWAHKKWNKIASDIKTW